MGGLADDGTEEIAPVTVVRGASTTITQRATRDGYTFLGWASVAGGTVTVPVGAQLTLERDTVLYAVWEALPHTVTFDVNGGMAADGSGDGKVIVKHDECVEEPAASARPTRDRMQFVGWTIERDGHAPYDFTTPVTNDLTLYAKWADEHAVIHTLTLDHRDGSGTVSRMFVEEGPVTLPDDATMKRDGYRFDGWMRNADGDGDADIAAGGQVEVTGDLTLYAKWVKVWNVTFDAGADADGSGDGSSGDGSSGGSGGGSGGVHVKQVDDGAPAGQPTEEVKRDGYRLEGWKLADTDDDTLYDLTQPVHGDMRLIAVWSHAGTPWIVRFNLNGGSVDSQYAAQVADQRVYDGEFAKRPEFKVSLGEELDRYKPQRKGYRFQGWSTVKNDALGLSVFRFDKQPIDRNCTLYALWERV